MSVIMHKDYIVPITPNTISAVVSADVFVDLSVVFVDMSALKK